MKMTLRLYIDEAHTALNIFPCASNTTFVVLVNDTFNCDIELEHWSWTFYLHKNLVIEPVHWAFTLSFYLFIEQKFYFTCISLEILLALYFGNNTKTFHGLKKRC